MANGAPHRQVLAAVWICLTGCLAPQSENTAAPLAAAEQLNEPEDNEFSMSDNCSSQDVAEDQDGSSSCAPVPAACDDSPDEGPLDWFADQDQDGFGGEFLTSSCSPISGATTQSGDCNDDDARIYPHSNERIDGVDADCDGAKDWLVQIYVAVDDAGELCVNDQVLGDTASWSDGRRYEHWMTSGPAAIGILGWDEGYHITAAIAHIEISNGTVWSSDASWSYSPDPNEASSKVGWCTPGFEETQWEPVRVLGPIGTEPWGNAPSLFPEESPAQWIWDHFPIELNSQYLRKVIRLP